MPREGYELDENSLTGNALGVELDELWLCGRSFLPSAAAYVAQVNQTVAGGSDDADAFLRPGNNPWSGATSTGLGQVYPHWNALRDAFQRVLHDSAENMYETADALVAVADLYAHEDAVAGQKLADLIERDSTSGNYPIDDPARRPELIPPT